MSLTKPMDPEWDAPARAQLAKALSWHYPNREYFNSLLVQKNLNERRYTNGSRKHDSPLLSINKDEIHERRRMRLCRQNRSLYAKSKSRSKTGILIHKAFIDFEKELDDLNKLKQRFDILCHNSFKMAPSSVPSAWTKSAETTTITYDKCIPPHEEWGAPDVPEGLSAQEERVYENLIRVASTRGSNNESPPEVIVITDLAKDYDDLSAMIVLKELHRLGLIKLIGFVANLWPARERAKFGRGCLDYLGLEDIPICWGTEAHCDAKKCTDPKEWEFPYEKEWFKDTFSVPDPVFTPFGLPKTNPNDHNEIESGVSFLERVVKQKAALRRADPTVPGFTFLLISGLSDIAEIAKRVPEDLALAASNVVLQGNYTIEKGPSYQGILTADLGAANNGFDKEASTKFHEYLDGYHIPSIVFSRAPAFATRQDSQLFKDLQATGHPLGKHLQWVQEVQDTSFYATACGPKPFLPRLNQEWFLTSKSNWYKKHPRNADGTPSKEPPREPHQKWSDIIPYTELVFYDVLAALGTAGSDALDALEVLEPRNLFETQDPQIHRIVGSEVKGQPPVPMMDVENVQAAVSALLKGSLECANQGISSTHVSWALWQQTLLEDQRSLL